MTPEIEALEAKIASLHYAYHYTHANSDAFVKSSLRNEMDELRAQIYDMYKTEIINKYVPTTWPQTVKDRLYKRAWDDGHSSGYHEVEMILEGLVDDAMFIIEEMLAVKQSV